MRLNAGKTRAKAHVTCEEAEKWLNTLKASSDASSVGHGEEFNDAKSRILLQFMKVQLSIFMLTQARIKVTPKTSVLFCSTFCSSHPQ